MLLIFVLVFIIWSPVSIALHLSTLRILINKCFMHRWEFIYLFFNGMWWGNNFIKCIFSFIAAVSFSHCHISKRWFLYLPTGGQTLKQIYKTPSPSSGCWTLCLHPLHDFRQNLACNSPDLQAVAPTGGFRGSLPLSELLAALCLSCSGVQLSIWVDGGRRGTRIHSREAY